MTEAVIDLEAITELQSEDICKLRETGITDLSMLANVSARKIRAILGFRINRAQECINEARELMNDENGGLFGFTMGENLLHQHVNRAILKTNQPVLDHLLDGGFHAGKVYEIYGPASMGKTTLLHQLACCSALPKKVGGLNNPGIIYLDCQNDFSLKRVIKMVPFWGISREELVKKIYYTAPPTTDSLVFMCEENLPKIMEQTGAKLIFLDSIASHFLAEYKSNNMLFPELEQKACRIYHVLREMARRHEVVVIVINQVEENPDAHMMSKYAPKYFFALQDFILHEPHVRIHMSRWGEFRKLQVEKSVDLPNNYCSLIMTDYGLLDPTVIKERRLRKSSWRGDEIKPVNPFFFHDEILDEHGLIRDRFSDVIFKKHGPDLLEIRPDGKLFINNEHVCVTPRKGGRTGQYLTSLIMTLAIPELRKTIDTLLPHEKLLKEMFK